MSGDGFEGDAVAQGGELRDVATGSAFDVDAGRVVVGAEVVERAVGSLSRFQMMNRIDRATATRALSLPRRLTMRR